AMLAALWDACAWLLNEHAAELSEDDMATIQGVQAFVSSWRRDEDELAAAPASEDGPWEAFEEAKQQAERLLPVVANPLRARNRVLGATYSPDEDVAAADLPVARLLWERMADRIRGQLESQRQQIGFFEDFDDLRVAIGSAFGVDAQDATAASFVVGVDLSDSGILTSLGGQCGFNRIDAVPRDFDRVMRRAIQRGDLWPEDDPHRAVVNVDALSGRASGRGFLPQRALISAVGSSFGLPGVTWVTDDAPRRQPDSPLDRYDGLNWSRIEPQLAPTLQFLSWLFREESLGYQSIPAASLTSNWRHGMGRIVDISAGETVPRVPRAGFLVALIGNRPDMDGIRTLQFAITGPDGKFRIPLLPAVVHSQHAQKQMAAFRLDHDGAIVEGVSTTASMVTTRLATSFSLSARPGEQLPRAVTFETRELNGPSFFDARFMEPLAEATLLDTVRGGAPQQSSFSIDREGQMWGLVPRDVRWQLILRAGAARVRMALLNVLPEGRALGLSERETFLRGFAVAEPLSSIPEHVSVRDLVTLNEWRLTDYRAAGITSEKVDVIRDVAREALAEADAAVLADDGAALKRAATVALSNEIRAYQAVRELGLDVSRGAIFLMLMLVPFSIAMERLIFASAKIGRQIVAAISIFAVMTTLLWSFHPAFSISAQPLIIVMAFTILAMSVVVIGMVLSRFKASVRELQSTLAEGSGAKMSRGGLVMSAVFLGIANMRKRKVRTALTGTTVVLVTFALLCFSSTSSFVDRRDFSLDNITSENSSVLVRRPTYGPLSWTARDVVLNLLAEHDVEVGERVWITAGLGQANWRMHLIEPRTGIQAPIVGVLGVSAIEDRLSGIDRVLPNWSTFAAEGGCYISSDTAIRLGVDVGDALVMQGKELHVRGIFDPFALEDDVVQLDGTRILPYDYGQRQPDWIDRDSQDVMEQETASAAAIAPDGDDGSLYIQGQDLLIVPADFAREMEGTLRSFGIVCESPEQASVIANALAQTIAFPAYYTNVQGGVNVLVSTPLVALPPRNIAIPLVIAALIIFTTILNSVSERKGEIYVYTSLGLAPTHVGALFVAEALTYGLMGAVFGYIAGQGVATFFTGLGLMEGITLNYSGTAVIKTMLLVQFVVVLSAIVPAIMAGKIASPSSEMDWKVPNPVDGEIRDLLPFTVSPAAARGLVGFIYEYLDAHRDGVLGGFDVDAIELLQPGEAGCVAGLRARLWLEPYDMGVRQTMRLLVDPEEDGACTISVVIRHEAGAPKVWWRLNRPFFFDLRRQLLGWRKLSPERLLAYVKSAMEV
ncbi:MAG: FtsX-like permease family protein, partial [Kiritimatiellia bacterium]